MSYTYGKKPKPLERLASSFRKVALVTAVAAVPAVPVAYNYGTLQDNTITVTDYELNKDGKKGHHVIYTDRGTYNLEPARLHFQSADDTDRMMRGVYRGSTYDISSYGYRLGMGWQPNIHELRRVSDQELAQRRRAAEGSQQPADATATPAGAAPVAASGALSGQMITTTVTVNGYAVEITLPAEAAGKVSIASVKPVVATPAVVAPAPVAPPPPQM